MFQFTSLKITTIKVVLFFIIFGFFIYGNSLLNDFMRDDNSLVVQNPIIRDIKNIPQLIFGSTFYGGDSNTLIGRYYRPVQSVYFTLIASTFGINKFIFHFFQVTLHIINAILLYKLFEKFFKQKLAVFLGLLFLVHPINTEAVIYVSAAQEILFLFFGLISLLLATKKTFTKLTLGILGATLLLSVLSKETGVLFTPLVLLYIYLNNRKYFLQFLALGAGVIIIYALMRLPSVGLYGIDGGEVASAPIMKLDFLHRMMHVPLIVFTYLSNFFFPKLLLINQSWIISQITVQDFYLPLVFDAVFFGLLAALGIVVWRKFNTTFKDYVFFLAIFLLGLGLHLHVIPSFDMTLTDRWFYLPIIGLIGLIGIVLNTIKVRSYPIKAFLAILAIIVVLALSVRVIYRNTDWKNEFTLVKRDIQFSRESYHLEQILANNYFLNSDIDRAIHHYKKSIQIYPYFISYTNLGTAYMRKNEFNAAEDAFEKALEIGEFYIAYEQLATMYYLKTHDYILARDTALKGLKRYPSNPKLLVILTFSYYKLNDLENAKKASALCYNRAKIEDCYKVYYAITNNIPINLNQ